MFAAALGCVFVCAVCGVWLYAALATANIIGYVQYGLLLPTHSQGQSDVDGQHGSEPRPQTQQPLLLPCRYQPHYLTHISTSHVTLTRIVDESCHSVGLVYD